jgi:hypothetical protein
MKFPKVCRTWLTSALSFLLVGVVLSVADRSMAGLEIVPGKSRGALEAEAVRYEPKAHVLLIGVDHVEGSPLHRLNGPIREVTMLSHVFQNSKGSILGTLVMVTNKDATRDKILKEIVQLRNKANRNDFIVIYWAGFSVNDVSDNVYLLTSDSVWTGEDKQPPTNSLSVAEDIIPYSSEANPLLLIIDGCNIGDALVGPMSRQYPYFAALTSSKADEYVLDTIPSTSVSAFASAFIDGLQGEAEDLDGDGLISAEEIYHYMYPRVLAAVTAPGVRTKGSPSVVQHPTVAGRYIHRIFLARAVAKQAKGLETSASQFTTKLELDLDVAQMLKDTSLQDLRINGKAVKKSKFDKEAGIIFLSNEGDSLLQRGINLMEVAKKQYVVWREKDTLKQFSIPYRRSRAILVAIDDYERKQDKQRRGPTGLQGLGDMVEKAKLLKKTLVGLGFREADVFTFFNEEATSSAVESLLRQFWEGAKYADTDRLFFYFGGHGIVHGENGLLVTYDYDPKRPTLTTLHLNDLRGNHASNIAAIHMISALDACYSGLALPRYLDGESPALKFDVLSVIQAEVTRRARNLLVAGTDDEKAIYINGGIFTEALTNGLNGEADRDRDGIIQFDELALYVRNKVTEKARLTGIRQVPSPHVLNNFGNGRILFLLPGLSNRAK